MTHPLTSVVIPTCARPQYLPRAVKSALACQGKDVEVIVVPNGSDQTWRQSLVPFLDDSRVRVSSIETAHGNIARNHGMSLARGKYIRFLDDDDYLLPYAGKQVQMLEQTRCHISVGGISTVAQGGEILAQRIPPGAQDLVESLLTPGRIFWLHAYVYRKEAIADFSWNRDVPLHQSKHWLYTLCKAQDWGICTVEHPVGAWFQHNGARVSGDQTKREQARTAATFLWEFIFYLKSEDRLDEYRKNLATAYLWQLICGAYHLEPAYWQTMVDNAMSLDPHSRPSLLLYRFKALQPIQPGLILRGTAPLLRGRRILRKTMASLGLYRSIVKD